MRPPQWPNQTRWKSTRTSHIRVFGWARCPFAEQPASKKLAGATCGEAEAHHVSKADSGQCDETVVNRVEVAPSFVTGKCCSSSQDGERGEKRYHTNQVQLGRRCLFAVKRGSNRSNNNAANQQLELTIAKLETLGLGYGFVLIGVVLLQMIIEVELGRGGRGVVAAGGKFRSLIQKPFIWFTWLRPDLPTKFINSFAYALEHNQSQGNSNHGIHHGE